MVVKLLTSYPIQVKGEINPFGNLENLIYSIGNTLITRSVKISTAICDVRHDSGRTSDKDSSQTFGQLPKSAMKRVRIMILLSSHSHKQWGRLCENHRGMRFPWGEYAVHRSQCSAVTDVVNKYYEYVWKYVRRRQNKIITALPKLFFTE